MTSSIPPIHRILVVDDNESIHRDFDRILGTTASAHELSRIEQAFFGQESSAGARRERPGFRVEHAMQGRTALNMVQDAQRTNQPYAMAFVDMRMPPGWDGLQTIEQLWQVDPDLHVVICTAYSNYPWEELLDHLDQPSQLLILKKPFDTVEVGQLAVAMAEKRCLLRVADMQMDQLQQRVDIRTRQLENARRESERFINAISSIVFGLAPDGRITRWNQTSEFVFGLTARETTGRLLTELSIEWDDRITVQRLLSGSAANVTSRTELGFTDKAGVHRLLGASVFPVMEDEEACGSLVLASDLTETRRMEQQLRSSQKLEAVGQLAAGVAHEINTPMQYLGDNTEYLSKSFEQITQLLDWAAGVASVTSEPMPLSEKRLASLRRNIPSALADSADGVAQVSRIVRAMKEFSHPGTESRVAVDINATLRNTLTVSSNEWKYAAELHTELDCDDRPVAAFAGELNQVFLNLIVNAAHAIEQADSEQGEIRVVTKFHDDWVEIRISDTGCGIPEAIRTRIFDPFFTTKDVGKGTGQGLALAHNVVVQKHGGRLWFESETGVGTTFIVELPYIAGTAWPATVDTTTRASLSQ